MDEVTSSSFLYTCYIITLLLKAQLKAHVPNSFTGLLKSILPQQLVNKAYFRMKHCQSANSAFTSPSQSWEI